MDLSLARLRGIVHIREPAYLLHLVTRGLALSGGTASQEDQDPSPGSTWQDPGNIGEQMINWFPRGILLRTPLPQDLVERFPVRSNPVIQYPLHLPLIGLRLRIKHCPLVEVETYTFPTENILLVLLKEGGMRSYDGIRRYAYLIAVLPNLSRYLTRTYPTGI